MGLFKRLFSIRSKKSKKQPAVDLPTESHINSSLQAEDSEEVVSRLLRSTTARYAAEAHIALNSLPPLPHPIDTVIPPPKSSSTTIGSVSARSTYSVTIHSRTVHSRTEFPNAYPPMDVTFTPRRSLTDAIRRRSKSVPITPRDKQRLLALRQDPSVASLLDHYNDEGHLNSALFSNTPSPQKDGRVQRRRTGSTLRQLLGHPISPGLRNSSTEGDISWAEKFLGETDRNSSVSSIGPQTPTDTRFTHSLSLDENCIECDTSATNHETFSSLEVELSLSTDPVHSQARNSPYDGSSTTPQRASQIFGFLGDKKKGHDGGATSKLPQFKITPHHYRHFSADSSDTKPSHIPLSRHSSSHIPQSISPNGLRQFSLISDANRSPPSSPTTATFLQSQSGDEESAIPQSVISQHTGQSSCGPYSPRLPSKIPSRPSSVTCDATRQPPSMRSVLGERSNTDNEHIGVGTPRARELPSQIPKLRSASGSSSSSAESKCSPAVHSPCRHPAVLQPGVYVKPKPANTDILMGNDTPSRLPQLVTPVRPFELRSHYLREVPSPASSSELSPVAKQMMANLRQQRMDARQRERQSGKLGSSQSRIRY